MRLLQGDCLELLPTLAENSIDAVICDPPYGVTANKWDSVISLDDMWHELKRVTKPNGAICLMGIEPFTSILITSNLDMFRYIWVWDKNKRGRAFHAQRMPLRQMEQIAVFYSKQCTYNPQMGKGRAHTSYDSKSKAKQSTNFGHSKTLPKDRIKVTTRYPTDIIRIPYGTYNNVKHPTQKPVDLMKYLVKTYTNEGDTVLDFAMGSGTTGVACKALKREFVGIELEPEYYELAENRISNEVQLELI